MLRFSSLGLLLAISTVLTVHSSAQISEFTDEVRHRSASNTWRRTVKRLMPLVERSLNSIDDEIDTSRKVVKHSKHINLEILSRESSSGSLEMFEDRVRGATVDRSLIIPMRRPISNGRIAYPPVLPVIHGHDRNLPFGTIFVETRKNHRKKHQRKMKRLLIRSSNACDLV